MRLLLLEARKSTLLWALVPIAVAWAAIAGSRIDTWLGSWPAASTSATTPIVYCGPVIGALCAYESARRGLSGLYDGAKLAPRSRWRGPLAHYLVHLVLAMVPLAVALVYVGARNLSTAPEGFFRADYLAYTFATLVVLATGSYLAGTAVGSKLVGAVAGIAVSLVVVIYADTPLSGAPHLKVSAGRMGLIAVLALGLVALTVVYASSATSNRATAPMVRRPLGAAAGVVAAGGLALAHVLVPSPIQVDRPTPGSPACSDTSPRVCLWPEHASYLSDITPLAERAAEAGDGVLQVPDTFYQYGVRDRDITSSFQIMAHGPGLWFTAGGMASTLINAEVVPNYCPARDDEAETRRGTLTTELLYWLQSRIYGSEQPSEIQGDEYHAPEARELLQEPEQAQQEWAHATLNEILETPCAEGSEA